MQIMRYKEIVEYIRQSGKRVFLWGCSEATKQLLKVEKLIASNLEGIIDNNYDTIKDPFFSFYALYHPKILSHQSDTILIVRGNHCKDIFEQLKAMQLERIDIIFDYDNGGKTIIAKKLYLNYSYEAFLKLPSKDELNFMSLPEIELCHRGGEILIHQSEAKKIFSAKQLTKAHIEFLNQYINNSKIYIGCGEDYRRGYLHCDRRDLAHVDIVCNAWEIETKIQNLSTIYSRHMLEHLTNKEAELTLQNWYQALQTDGYVEIIVPNFDLRAQQWLSCEWELGAPTTQDEIWAVAGCWGWQRECNPLQENYNQSYWDVHKSGYNEKRITKILSHIGFKEIKTNVDIKNNLIAIAYKR